MARLPSPDRSQWSEQARAVFKDRIEPGTSHPSDARQEGGPPNILWTISHHPALLEPFLGFAATLAIRGVLTRRDSEILALRAAWNCSSAFEWGHHVEFALAAGMSDEEIANIAVGPNVESWSPHDRLLILAADQLHERHTIDPETWRALADELSPAQLVELTFVVGNYTMLSMVANATEVPLEPGLPAMPPR